jgi:phosphonoacetate hydrolase
MIEVNGRRYRSPRAPTVILCLDGSDPAYIEDAVRHARIPTLARWMKEGAFAIADAAMPTFTNPNNVSIVTGVPPSLHGICGNFFFDADQGIDVPMNDPAQLSAPQILAALEDHASRVAAVTAKDKLVRLLATGARACFSVEKPNDAGREIFGGKAPPDVYSADASLWVLDAGVEILKRDLADVLYLSTTDYVQHKHAPGTDEARAFYEALDVRLSNLERARKDVVVALTADHGMNDKTKPDGSPNVVYLAAILDRALGEGTRVTLPITDPYVVHHGALGSCAMVYVLGKDPKRAREVIEAEEGIERVLAREEAAAELALPAGRIGDLVVLAEKRAVLGKREADHDLSHVRSGLRSHGGLHERAVPLLVNRPVSGSLEGLRNFDVFDLALNRAE